MVRRSRGFEGWRVVLAGVGLLYAAAALAQATEGPPPPAAAAIPGITYATTFAIDGGDPAVEKVATDTSSLKTLEKDAPPGPPGLVGRAKADIERIAAALMATGRYSALVDVTIAGVSVKSESAASAAQRSAKPVPVVIRIMPGPVFTLGVVRIQPLDGGAAQAASIAPEKVGLVPGQPAPSTAIFSAESKIVDVLRNDGYPFAAVKGRDAVADHARNQLDVTIKVAAGLQAPLGDVTITGTRDVDVRVVQGRVPFKPGERYSPEKIQELRDEIAKLDVFSSIRVREGTAPDASGRVPVTVEVEEKKFRYVGAAAKYDSIDGAGVNAYWGHRNLFGGAEKFRIDAGASRLITNKPQQYEYSLKAHFEKPGIWTGFDDLLIDVEALRERPIAYERDGIRAAAAIRRRLTSDLSVQIGVEGEASTIRDTFGKDQYFLVGVPFGVTFDNTDSKLDPSSGVKFVGTAAPYYNFKGQSKSLNIFQGTLSTYTSFDEAKRVIFAAKVGFGTIIGAQDLSDVPANRRFFAGGGGSIRGFAYQSASPYCSRAAPKSSSGIGCGVQFPIGGRSLLTTSFEPRIKITDTIGVVPFIDAGSAFANETPDFKLRRIRVGAGIGLRYYTAIGPIRFDVATPVVGKSKNDSIVAFYISIGQSF